MKGTSGAAERSLLRGRFREAALSHDGESRSGSRGAQAPRDGVFERCRGHSSHEGRGRVTRGVRADWVGAKSSDASNRTEGSRQALPKERRPLTHDSSVPLLRKEASGSRPGRNHTAKAVEPSPRKAWSFVDPSVVLANGFDCRSRRAARGAERSRAMSPRKRRCLAFRLREAKKRRKPGQDGKVLENSGWRARVRGVAKAAPSEHSSMEGALGRESRCPLTRRRWKGSWLSLDGFRPIGVR